MKDFDLDRHQEKMRKEFRRLQKENKKLKDELERFEKHDQKLKHLALRCGASTYGGGATGINAINAIERRLDGMQVAFDQLHIDAATAENEPEIMHLNVLDQLKDCHTPIVESLRHYAPAHSITVSIATYKKIEPQWGLGTRDRTSDLIRLIITESIECKEDFVNPDNVSNAVTNYFFYHRDLSAKPELLNSSIDEVMSIARRFEAEIINY